MKSDAVCQSLETLSKQVNAGLRVFGWNKGQFMETFFFILAPIFFQVQEASKEM